MTNQEMAAAVQKVLAGKKCTVTATPATEAAVRRVFGNLPAHLRGLVTIKVSR